jgi:hypothetical protein
MHCNDFDRTSHGSWAIVRERSAGIQPAYERRPSRTGTRVKRPRGSEGCRIGVGGRAGEPATLGAGAVLSSGAGGCR